MRDLNKLSRSNDEWGFVSVLTDTFKPFHMSTVLLQTQKYYTLSIGKIIENMLIKYFERKQNDSNSSDA